MAKKLFSLTPAQDNLLVPKTTTANVKTETEPPKNYALKNTRTTNKITNVSSSTSGIVNPNCTLVSGDTTINVCSDKCVNVFVTENLTEQKYIKNVEGSGSLCVGTLNTSNVYNNIVTSVCKLGFDTDSGFEVTDLGSGLAKIGMNSTFKYWEVNGSSGLIACGLDTVNFVAGSNVTITSDNTAIPKTLTISATGGGGGASQATPTALGTVFGCTDTYGLTALGYCVGGSTYGGNFNTTAIGAYASKGWDYGGYPLCNTVVGYGSMRYHTGSGNIAMGIGALQGTSGGFGFYNVSIGDCAMRCNYNGNCNVSIGYQSMILNCNGKENVAVGVKALCNNTNSCYNTAIGALSQVNNYGNGGHFNTSLGAYSLWQNVTGVGNTAIGYGALSYGKGSCNIGVGYQAGCDITTGVNNTVIGHLNGTAGMVCTVLIGAGTCERIKVDNNGLCINGAPFTASVNLDAYCSLKIGNGLAGSTGINNFAFGCNALLCNLTGTNNIAIGNNALYCNTGNSGDNIALGRDTLRNTTTGGGNVAIGASVLCANTTGCFNVGIGYSTIICNTFGVGNVAIGLSAMRNNTDGNQNVAIGTCALPNVTGDNNVAIGENAMYGNTGGSQNVAIGRRALRSNTQGGNNISLGNFSSFSNTTGSFNFAVGLYGLYSNRTGTNNIAVGCRALLSNVSGSDNIALGQGSLCSANGTGCNIGIGQNAGSSITTGVNNTVIGNLVGSAGLVCTVLIGAGTCERIRVDNNGLCINGSLFTAPVSLDAYCSFKVGNGLSSSTGLDNIAIGCNTLLSNNTGYNNIGAGEGALQANTSGYDNFAQGYKAAFSNTGGNNLVAIGYCALYSTNVTCTQYGINHIAIGCLTLASNTTGRDNIAIGARASRCLVYASNNIAIGYNSMASNVGGDNNVAIGYRAMFCTNGNMFFGKSNTAIGYGALEYNLTGYSNIAIGVTALRANVSGYGNVAVGNNAGGSSTGLTNVFVGQQAGDRVCGSANVVVGSCAFACGGGVGAGVVGGNNVIIGDTAAFLMCNGSENATLGNKTLYGTRTGSRNIAIGSCAGCAMTTGQNNTIIGNLTGSAGLVCTVLIGAGTCERIKVDNNGLCINGSLFSAPVNLDAYCSFKVGNGLASSTGLDNFAFGCNALLSATTGCSNFAVGWEAGTANTYGNGNISIGRRANRNNSIGYHNIALGENALYGNNGGCHNIAMGRYAMQAGGSGSRNIALGYGSLSAVLTGCRNIVIGTAGAACDITTGINNTIIGNLPGGSGGVSCTVLIGAGQTERIKVDDTGLYINGSLFTGGGVSSLNTLTGAVTLSAGTNVTIGSSGNTLTINSTGGSSASATFTVANSGSTAYTINTLTDPTLNLIRGQTYVFNVSATGHPFWIKTAQVTGTGSAYNTGVTNNGTENGTITFVVPLDAPDTLYYICQVHSVMTGIIAVSDAGVGDGLSSTSLGFRILPQNSQSTDYTLVAADSGKHLLHPSTDTNARTFTIPANSSVAYPIGTSITFINETSQVLTINITSDTMYLAGSGLTGSRTLSQYGVATAIKTGSTTWYISGTGLT